MQDNTIPAKYNIQYKTQYKHTVKYERFQISTLQASEH